MQKCTALITTNKIDRNGSVLYDICFQRGNGSEDCLYLNLWTPNLNQTANLPVMVYIHGGSFTIGSNLRNGYNGIKIAEKGVVSIFVQYRLGIFGNMYTENEDIPGNQYIWDVIRALEWVQENVKFFGGDPENVTIFGNSAGGQQVAKGKRRNSK